jgi:hypothetical protein
VAFTVPSQAMTSSLRSCRAVPTQQVEVSLGFFNCFVFFSNYLVELLATAFSLLYVSSTLSCRSQLTIVVCSAAAQ